MCGLFAVFAPVNTELDQTDVTNFVELGKSAQRRGIDASGLVLLGTHFETEVIKTNEGFGQLIKAPKCRLALGEVGEKNTIGLYGHTRLETHGYSGTALNNQPINIGGWLVVHNGVITNANEIRSKTDFDDTGVETDSVAIALLLEEWSQNGRSENIDRVFARLKGEFSIIATSTSGDILFHTNVGSLFRATDERGRTQIASEPRQFHEKLQLGCSQLPINTTIIHRHPDAVVNDPSVAVTSLQTKKTGMEGARGLHLGLGDVDSAFTEQMISVAQQANQRANQLRRCTKCILPATFPNITFNDDGVCSVCTLFQVPSYPGIGQLAEDLAATAPADGRVLTCLSGGRDSCYILHLMVEMGFSPIAYTYDWGMVTTTARENMARMCGQLGVEHIVVSPDIRKNRQRINHSLKGWLKKPKVATIPLLMAGDKPYFRWARIVAGERGGIPAILADHPLETTGFKSMLAGATMSSNPEGGVDYRLSNLSLAKMALTYGTHALQSPRLIPSIATEGAIGFVDYYIRSHNFFRPFSYIPWEEETIEKILYSDYGWSAGRSHSSTAWRMGDGTAPFYNLMYLIKLGLTEHDTMRSNQIRYGMISRSEALDMVANDNQLNVLGLASYFSTVEIDLAWASSKIREFSGS